jgi:hypothetical protein
MWPRRSTAYWVKLFCLFGRLVKTMLKVATSGGPLLVAIGALEFDFMIPVLTYVIARTIVGLTRLKIARANEITAYTFETQEILKLKD